MRLARYLTPRAGQPREFLRRANKVAGDLNVVLVVLALGLATLDFTFLVTQKVIENLPPATQMVYPDQTTPATPSSAQPPRH